MASIDEHEKSGAISQMVQQELLKWKDSLGIFQILQRASEEFEMQKNALDDEI